MKRLAIVSAAAIVFLQLAVGADARPQQPRPSRTPALTSDDLLSPGVLSSPGPEENPSAIHPRGATVPNAVSVLRNALTKITTVKSVRTRIQAFLPTGQREVVIETVKPDRTHVVSPEGEIITIAGKVYLNTGDGWQVTPVAPAIATRSDAGVDFSALVKEMIDKSKVLITGHMLGDRVFDEVDCSVYEFEVTDRSGTGTIQVSVGKKDGYMRRLEISGPAQDGAFRINVWFDNINQPISIKQPM